MTLSTPYKNRKIGQKIDFRKSYGNRKPRLLSAQNSRSFSSAPLFDQVTFEKPNKNRAILV